MKKTYIPFEYINFPKKLLVILKCKKVLQKFYNVYKIFLHVSL